MMDTNQMKTNCIAIALLLSLNTFTLQAQDRSANLSLILGRPTDRSIAVSVLAATDSETRVEYGPAKTPVQKLKAGVPTVFEITGLQPNTRYSYRVGTQEGAFQTQRAAGSTFAFGVQGDSHPERAGKMFDAKLYELTMRNVAQESPDFYVTMGDDFSLDRLIEHRQLSQPAVDEIYARQRGYLGVVGRSAPLFLVNGNHEHADRCLLDGTETNAAVLAGRARTKFYPLPAPDSFYTGDAEEVKFVGLPRDYYAWTWGDALFVVIDFYWHSPAPVDHMPSETKGDGKKRDPWDATLGDAQYRWLTKTLTESKARWKFVFCHHVLGTGRGGIECAARAEWGDQADFATKRPGWALPIHKLFVKTGVTIFFQGHDHIFARQELDGVTYQSCPNPADNTYQTFNRDAYRSGDILPNAGHLRVTVAPQKVRVDYVRSFLPGAGTNASVAFSYTIPK